MSLICVGFDIRSVSSESDWYPNGGYYRSTMPFELITVFKFHRPAAGILCHRVNDPLTEFDRRMQSAFLGEVRQNNLSILIRSIENPGNLPAIGLSVYSVVFDFF